MHWRTIARRLGYCRVTTSRVAALLLATSAAAFHASPAHAQANSIDPHSPGPGELTVVGKVLAVLPAEHRLAISVVKVIASDGTVNNLQQPVSKSILFSSSTLCYALSDSTKKVAIEEIQPNAVVEAMGLSDGPGSPLTARVIALEADPNAEQQALWDSLPGVQKDAWWRLLVKLPAEAHAVRDKDGSFKLTVIVPSAKPSNVQIMQGGLKLVNGQTWRLHFRAKADDTRVIKVSAIVGAGDYHSIGLREDVTLTTMWKDFDYTFTVAKTTDGDKLLCPTISVGDKPGTVWLTNLTLTQLPKSPATTQPEKPQ